ncbi:MAG: hypothetical protein MN733_26895, partial [Nitrososphaera sp.]|nr:hypothetical protein [Nitrososphaera sp.]
GGTCWHDSDEFSKLGHYGGRVELFAREGTDVSYTDINSLYPSVMTEKFPDYISTQSDIDCEYGIADVTIAVSECVVAPLPFRDSAARVLFPTGVIRGVWTVHEIRDALAHGAKLIKLHACQGANSGSRYYTEFVQTCYERRLDSKSPAEKLFWKLLMNNLYGRLGISGEITRSVQLTDKTMLDGIPYGCKVLTKYKMPLPDFANYCHATYVASYARLRLLYYLRLVPEGRLVYCDTDSIVFEGSPNFTISDKLGSMKLEGNYDRCITYAPKCYETIKDGTRKCRAKGVPVKCQEQYIDTGRAEFDLPFKLREAIAFYDRQNSKRLSVWRRISKEFRTTYDKKKLIDNRYFPLHFGCGEVMSTTACISTTKRKYVRPKRKHQ